MDVSASLGDDVVAAAVVSFLWSPELSFESFVALYYCSMRREGGKERKGNHLVNSFHKITEIISNELRVW